MNIHRFISDFVAMDLYAQFNIEMTLARQLAVAAMVAAEKYEWIFKPGKYEEQQQCQS